MKKYNKPYIDVLLFDDEEDILTVSTGTTTATYSAKQLNEYMFENANVTSTTTIKLQDVQVSGN